MDHDSDIALYEITAYNSNALYFWGREVDCDRYVQWLNRDRDAGFYSQEIIPQDQWVDFEDRDDVVSGEEPGWDDFMEAAQEMSETALAVQAAADDYGWGTRAFASELSDEGFGSSDEILMAIGDICEDAEDFVRIWEDPTEAEFREVVRLAFASTLDDEEELDWGQEVVTKDDLTVTPEVAPSSASKAALEEVGGEVQSLGPKADGPSPSL